MNKLAVLASAGTLLAASHAFAQDSAAELEKFRAAYASGKGLTYLVVPGEKGERIYRYGDASRETAKRDKRGFMMFTCTSPKVFVSGRVSDRAALAKARVVQAGEPEYAALDAKYIQRCKNPFVKSALSKSK